MSKPRTKPEPTQVELKKWVRYDPATGIFYCKFVPPKSSRKLGQVLGTVVTRNGLKYLCTSFRSVSYSLHRLAFIYMTGSAPQPPSMVDHKDRNGLNNRWKNLRSATWSVNNLNRRSTTGVGCVTKYGRKLDRFRVIVGRTHVGIYPTVKLAQQARDTALEMRNVP